MCPLYCCPRGYLRGPIGAMLLCLSVSAWCSILERLDGEFDCEFEILGVRDHDELVGSGADLLSRVLVGWDRLMNEAGDAPVDFSEAEKTAMLDITYVRAAITLAYYEAAHGNKAKRKNSH